MIIVSRLNGQRFVVNADLVERVEETPDTVLTLLDGRKYLVRESLQDVIDLVVDFRAQILRVSYQPVDPQRVTEIPLRLVEGEFEHEGSPSGSPVGGR